jgi:hypothetical protein
MAAIIFEEKLEHFQVQGNCSCEVVEMTPPGTIPSNLIRTDQEWAVRLHWTTHGDLAPILDGLWKVQILMEAIGVAEYQLPVQYRLRDVPFDQHSYHEYDITLTIPKGIVPAGVYKLVVVVSLVGKTTGVPAPVAGFSEGPLLNFFSASF